MGGALNKSATPLGSGVAKAVSMSKNVSECELAVADVKTLLMSLQSNTYLHILLCKGTPLCRLCGRLDDLISERTRAVGATVTAGIVTLIGLPRMAR